MSEKSIQASGHFQKILDSSELAIIVEQSVALLCGLEFDTLAFIGFSGAIPASIIAYKMSKELLMVRKNGGEKCNSGMWIEGHVTAKRIVVVDDLISSGKTMSQMMYAIQHVKKQYAGDVEVVGLLLHMCGNYDIQYRPELFLPGTEKFTRMEVSGRMFNHPITGEPWAE